MKTLSAKKFLACLMAVLVLFTSLSIGAVSADIFGDFEFEVCTEYDEDFNPSYYLEITGYNGTATEITIPSEIEGKAVTSIGWGAFEGNSTLTTVTVPDSVTQIGSWAFSDCENLTTLNLPNTLTVIGCGIVSNSAIFNNEDNFENGLLYIDKYLIDADYSFEGAANIKEGTEVIAEMTFFLADVTSVKLPESLRYIGESAFSDCENITEIILPTGLKEIEGFAFSGCEGLKSIVIPEGVEYIGMNCFEGCTNLASANLPESFTEIPAGIFSNCESLKNFTIPENVTEISIFAFDGAGIETLHFPASVEYAPGSAFMNCKNLKSFTVDSANEKFYEIEGILYRNNGYSYLSDELVCYPAAKDGDTYTFPENVYGTDAYAFYGNENIKTIVLNDIVEYCSIYEALGLEKFQVPAENPYYSEADGVLFSKNGSQLILYPAGKKDASYVVPSSVTTVDNYAFSCNPYITELTFHENIEEILSCTVENCENLKTLNIPAGIAEIDYSAFENLESLETINYGGTKAEFEALELYFYGVSDKGLYAECTDGRLEVVAPNSEPDFDIPTLPTEPEASTSTEPESTVPSTSVDPTETTGTQDGSEYELGDVNMDSKLNIKDATSIQKYVAKLLQFDETQLSLADYNQDTKVNVKDATTIQKKIANLL